jgi:hypothetical protein
MLLTILANNVMNPRPQPSGGGGGGSLRSAKNYRSDARNLTMAFTDSVSFTDSLSQSTIKNLFSSFGLADSVNKSTSLSLSDSFELMDSNTKDVQMSFAYKIWVTDKLNKTDKQVDLNWEDEDVTDIIKGIMGLI